MNLSIAPMGVALKILKIKIEGDQKKLLANMWFVVDANVTVVAENAGNLIINIKDSRVAIGQDLDKKIMVSPV